MADGVKFLFEEEGQNRFTVVVFVVCMIMEYIWANTLWKEVNFGDNGWFATGLVLPAFMVIRWTFRWARIIFYSLSRGD
jgi:hypothetical protein